MMKETEQSLQIERLKAENKQLKQDISMLVTFIDDIEYIVAAMPTFRLKIEKILDYSEDTIKLKKFLAEYHNEVWDDEDE